MENMAKKNGHRPAREGTAAAVREAAQAGGMTSTTATPEKPKRRIYTAEYKRRILREADAARAAGVEGGVGELLRREGLYSSHLTEWARQRDAGEVAGLTPQKRGPKPSADAAAEVARLQRRVAQLEAQLRKSEIIIDVQKKVAGLLGATMAEPTEETSDVDAAPSRSPR